MPGKRAILFLFLFLFPSAARAGTDCVILLHGLARSSTSMKPMQRALEAEGYLVANINYDSRKRTIEELAPKAIQLGLEACEGVEVQVHFVTHSMGGILVRYYLQHHSLPTLGRVVMLAPPNQGSEVVDNWAGVPGFKAFNGPAGLQLGTDSTSIPQSLGPVHYPVGVIAGTRTVNPILSLSLPNPDDGKVSVERTKVEGMADFIELRRSHTFIMRADDTIEQTLHFLAHGRFRHEAPETD